MRNWFLAISVSFCACLSALPQGLPQEQTDMPKGFLAEGFIKVTIHRYEYIGKYERDEAGELLLLTDKEFLYRDREGYQRRLRPEGGEVLWIQAEQDEKQRWKVDKAKNVFIGPVVNAPTAIQVQPKACTTRDEEQYLYFTLRRLNQIADPNIEREDKVTLDAVNRNAQAVVGRIAQEARMSTKLKAELDGLGAYVSGQLELAQQKKKLFEDNADFRKAMARIRADTMNRAGAIVNLSGVQGVVQSILSEDPSPLFDHLRTVAEVRYVLADEENFLQNKENEQTQRINSQVTDINRKKENNRRDRQIAMTKLAPELGLPADDVESVLEQSHRDIGAIIRTLDSYVDNVKQATKRLIPWLELEVADVHSRQFSNSKTGAAELIGLSDRCLASANFVPPGKAYDGDRATVLWKAASLASLAALLDNDKRPWMDTYNPYAAKAERMFKYADTLTTFDVNGSAREYRMIALALSRKPDEALQLGLDLAEIRAGSTNYHYYMARLQAVKNNAPEVLKHAKLANLSGLKYNELANSTDIAALRANKKFKTEFDQATAPAVKGKVVAQGVAQNPFQPFAMANVQKLQLVLENRAQYRMTNVKVSINFANQNGPVGTVKDIAAGAKEDFDIPSFNPNIAAQTFFSLTCDQGKIDRIVIGP